MISQVFHAQNVLSLFNSVTTKVAVVSLEYPNHDVCWNMKRKVNIRSISVQKSRESVSRAFPCPFWELVCRYVGWSSVSFGSALLQEGDILWLVVSVEP